jgi:hypothetical protein
MAKSSHVRESRESKERESRRFKVVTVRLPLYSDSGAVETSAFSSPGPGNKLRLRQKMPRSRLYKTLNYSFNIILVNLLDSDWLETVPIKH